MAPILSFSNARGVQIEIFLLNVGQCFERFGGRSHGRTVKKTASMIIRSKDPETGIMDREVEIDDPSTWGWIRALTTDPDMTLATP